MISEAMARNLAEDLGISVDDVKIFFSIAEKNPNSSRIEFRRYGAW